MIHVADGRKRLPLCGAEGKVAAEPAMATCPACREYRRERLRRRVAATDDPIVHPWPGATTNNPWPALAAAVLDGARLHVATGEPGFSVLRRLLVSRPDVTRRHLGRPTPATRAHLRRVAEDLFERVEVNTHRPEAGPASLRRAWQPLDALHLQRRSPRALDTWAQLEALWGRLEATTAHVIAVDVPWLLELGCPHPSGGWSYGPTLARHRLREVLDAHQAAGRVVAAFVYPGRPPAWQPEAATASWCTFVEHEVNRILDDGPIFRLDGDRMEP